VRFVEGRNKILVVALCLGLGGTLLLYAYAASIGPRRASIGELGPGDIGSLVQVSGHVKERWATSSGDTNMVLVDYSDGASMRVFVDDAVMGQVSEGSRIIPGAEVSVTGEVQTYKGALEIAVRAASGIELLKEASENVVGIELLTRNPVYFDGMTVRVQGRIYDIPTFYTSNSTALTRFTLVSEGSNYRVLAVVFGWDWSSDARGIEEGMNVAYEGVWGYYDVEARWQISSDTFTLVKVG